MMRETRIWERVVPLMVGTGKQIGTAVGSGVAISRQHWEKKDGRRWARDIVEVTADEGPATDSGNDVDGANGAKDEGASGWGARVRLSEMSRGVTVGSSCARESVVDACLFFGLPCK